MVGKDWLVFNPLKVAALLSQRLKKLRSNKTKKKKKKKKKKGMQSQKKVPKLL